jgi:hypothetical protein
MGSLEDAVDATKFEDAQAVQLKVSARKAISTILRSLIISLIMLFRLFIKSMTVKNSSSSDKCKLTLALLFREKASLFPDHLPRTSDFRQSLPTVRKRDILQ